jgi:hypothetical protein
MARAVIARVRTIFSIFIKHTFIRVNDALYKLPCKKEITKEKVKKINKMTIFVTFQVERIFRAGRGRN